MKFARIAICVLAGCVCLVASQVQAVDVSNWDFQAVNENGVSTWNSQGGLIYPITITGVILNNPEDMLDSTYDPDAVENNVKGAEWQLFIQGIGTDHNGTALWMGQNYNAVYSGTGTYPAIATQENPVTWADEMFRLNYDSATGHQFRQGDLVTVTVNASKFYGGKRNINEDHDTNPDYNFTITLSQADYGLPAAEEIILSDLYVDSGITGYDVNCPMFDASRNTGAEYYQGTYVKLTGLTLTDDSGWGKTAWGERICYVEDEFGNEFTLRMPLNDIGDAPTGEFSVYGIINQESGSGQYGLDGYEIFVMQVVPEPASLMLLAAGGVLLRKRKRRV